MKKLKFFLLSTILTSHLIWAQDKLKDDTLKYRMDEIVIIGTRTVERIIDIPYSVFKVEKKELSFGRKASAKDVLTDVPGLFLQSRFGGNDLRISIRGFGTRSNSGTRGFKILQDGIPESEPDGETVIDAVDFTSLGGVEVIKSNLSSLYANAPGGIINFVSDIYFPRNFVSINNQIGKYGFRQNGFKIGIKTNEYKFLLTYNYKNYFGYRAHSNEFQHLINSVYESFLGTRSFITILSNYVRGFSQIPGPLTVDEFESDPFQAWKLAVSQDFRKETMKGRIAIRFKTNFGELNNNELELTGYGSIKEFEKSDNELFTYSTRYSLGSIIRFTNDSKIFDRRNVVTIGLDYAFQTGPVTEFENIYGNKGIQVQNHYKPSLSNIGFYILDHYNVLPELLDLFISSRFDKYLFSREIYIPFGFTDTVRQFQKLTPKVGVNFKIAPSIALYSSYGLGYDFPALSELANTPLSSNIKYSLNPDLNPQKSKNFEFGIKGNLSNAESDFMKKLFFEITYFNYLIQDEIVPFVIYEKTYFRNTGSTKRIGAELSIKSEPFEETELTINYTFTNFKYTDYSTTIYTPSGTIIEDYKGNLVPSVPKHIINFILNKEFEITDEISGLLQWDCDYISDMFLNDSNTDKMPGYFYGNAMIGVNMNFSNFYAIAFLGINNIFDKRYAGFVNINDYYKRYYETGEPRFIYFGLNLKYHI